MIASQMVTLPAHAAGASIATNFVSVGCLYRPASAPTQLAMYSIGSSGFSS
jgi:hypothetical protein